MIACTACKADLSYSVDDYLKDLAEAAGIGYGESDFKEALSDWGVITEEEETAEELDYAYVTKTIFRLIGEEGTLSDLIAKGWIPGGKKETGRVERKIAEEVIRKAVRQINEPEFEDHADIEYAKEVKTEADGLNPGDLILEEGGYRIVTRKDENGYESREAEFQEIFSGMELEGSEILDFSDAEVIPFNEEDSSSYINEKYHLLASKDHSFTVKGFKVIYSLNRSGIDVHVKRDDGSAGFYADLSVYDVKPTFRFESERNDLKNCFFTVSMRTSEEVGYSVGKYGDYYLRFKDLDCSSFKALLDSLIDPIADKTEASIPICRIRTPIPNLPFVYLNLDLYLKAYADGNVRLLIKNVHHMGFETKNGHIRFINDHDNDYDASLQASARAGMAINVGLDTAGCRLADVELDGGLKAKVSTTLHLYDDQDRHDTAGTNVSYSAAEEIAKQNENVKVCGDVSLYWYMDLLINTARTQMSRLGFGRSFQILDEEDQVFGNLHHIENGHFVEKCTRRDRTGIKQMDPVRSDRIVLDSYAEVLKRKQTYRIAVRSLPEGYQKSDLRYSSENEAIATVKDGTITAVSPGSVRIAITTADGRYSAYVNILVSTG